MSGISFEWVQRNAERINKAIADASNEPDANPAQVIMAFIMTLALSDNDYSYITYDISREEFNEIMDKTVDFLTRAGIEY